jgi:hypothetical protein
MDESVAFFLIYFISQDLQLPNSDSPPLNPEKEINEEEYLTHLFNHFQSFQPGKQKLCLGDISKIFEGGYSVAIEDTKSGFFKGIPPVSKNKRKNVSKIFKKGIHVALNIERLIR